MPEQRGFAAALLDPRRPAPDGLQAPGGAPATTRFDVYRNNVVVSLIEALGQGFPAVRALVGAEFFDAMAGVFVRQHPPTSPLMMFYGAELPAFLEGFPPAAALPYLSDVARLEFARREAYHAEDAAPADPARLGAVPPERLGEVRLVLAPAVRTVASRHPIFDIRRRAFGGPDPRPGAQEVLVARPDLDPVEALLPPGGAAAVAALRGAGTLGDAAALTDLAQLLPPLFQTQAIAEIGAPT